MWSIYPIRQLAGCTIRAQKLGGKGEWVGEGVGREDVGRYGRYSYIMAFVFQNNFQNKICCYFAYKSHAIF